jgi:hypothetical protein
MERGDRKFRIECLDTGEVWRCGLTWTGEAADRALVRAKGSCPDRNWVLREVRA